LFKFYIVGDLASYASFGRRPETMTLETMS